MLRPRALIVSLALIMLVAPLAAGAQQATKVYRIGFLEAGSSSANRHFLDAFRQGLRELGYMEGQRIAIEDRWADGRSEQFPGLVTQIIAFRPDVIVVASTPGARAVKNGTSTIPVIFVAIGDPVGAGLVESLSRPGGNMTGLSLAFDSGFVGKWVELLKEVLPSARRVGLLWNPETVISPSPEGVQNAAKAMGLELESFTVRESEAFEVAFTEMSKRRIDGLIVMPDVLTVRHRSRIVGLAAKERLPTIYGFADFGRAGGLIAYSANVPDLFRRAAIYVDRILRGTKPSDLPIEQPTKFELVINLQTAKALGLTIPQSLLLRADQLIE
jgi:putative tryptophan/tyrosine transport system substrate-binding protein